MRDLAFAMKSTVPSGSRSIAVAGCVCLALAGGCSLASNPGDNPPPGDDLASAPPPGPADMASAPSATLPFAVDNAFVPSGFMGDGTTSGLIAMLPAKPGDSKDCDGQRSSAAAKGICHQVSYTPPAANGKGWGGVYWQYPENNWGMSAGYAIAGGATKVAFSAKGAAGGEKVTFLVGGITGAGNPYQDTIKATVDVVLTTDWATYSIDTSGQSYTQVIGGFGWTMAAKDAGTAAKFYVDDVQWE